MGEVVSHIGTALFMPRFVVAASVVAGPRDRSGSHRPLCVLGQDARVSNANNNKKEEERSKRQFGDALADRTVWFIRDGVTGGG